MPLVCRGSPRKRTVRGLQCSGRALEGRDTGFCTRVHSRAVRRANLVQLGHASEQQGRPARSKRRDGACMTSCYAARCSALTRELQSCKAAQLCVRCSAAATRHLSLADKRKTALLANKAIIHATQAAYDLKLMRNSTPARSAATSHKEALAATVHISRPAARQTAPPPPEGGRRALIPNGWTRYHDATTKSSGALVHAARRRNAPPRLLFA